MEDALFCHKCGKPTRELAVAVEEDEAAAPAVETPAAVERPAAAPAPILAPGPEIHLRNALTVRVALLGAGFQLVAGALLSAGGPYLGQVAPVLAGGFACYLFQRRSGFRLSVLEGARLGWMTGIMCFVAAVILITIVMAAASSEPFMATVRESSASGLQGEALKALERLQSEPSQLLLLIPYQFLMLTLLASVGGALGAKLLSRD